MDHLLKRTMVCRDGPNEATRLRNVLNCGLEPNYENAIVVKAYHHQQHEAVFLAGIPDMQAPIPHA
ncbi:MAG: hypothetical protein U1E05_04970 [Patescibacteria group bacterium]|nr:hypothetical protein [Patescibacteria group bacterium]